MGKVSYQRSDTPLGFLDVCYIDNKTGVRLVKSFDSEYQARVFVNRLKHSKKCTLVYYPTFR